MFLGFRCVLRPRPALCTLACPTLVSNPCDFGQRSAATIRLRPWRRLLAPKQSEVSPPDARSALRTPSQALRRRSDRSRRDPRLALPALPWDCASRASQRPPVGPHSYSRAVARSPGAGAGRLRDSLAIFPICSSRCSAPGPGNAVPPGSGPGARPTKLRPCPCLRRFRGRGPARRDSYSDLAKPASRHLPA